MRITINIILILIFINSLFSQVNVEALRSDDKIPGIKHNLVLDFSYISSDVKIIQIATSYGMDYRLKSGLYGFILGEYERAFEENQEDFSNRGFIHCRIAKPLIRNTDIESFAQKERNQFIDLNNRELIGAGLRINQFKNLYWGVGIMHELEEYSNNHHKLIKSTNYINHKLKLLEIMELSNVIYYQFQIDSPKNNRALWDGSIIIHTEKGVSFNISAHYRYDNQQESYFVISNGIGINF
tara:strand:- start:1184 stop:1903 length:720 start_codon:yes stop_codon:yes gene_type:complete